MTELEQVIRELIRDIYKKEYLGKIHINKLNPIGYSIKLDLGIRNKPVTIYAELEGEQLYSFLKQEIKDRRFNLVDYGELNLVNQYDCSPINKSCCNDKR